LLVSTSTAWWAFPNLKRLVSHMSAAGHRDATLPSTSPILMLAWESVKWRFTVWCPRDELWRLSLLPTLLCVTSVLESGLPTGWLLHLAERRITTPQIFTCLLLLLPQVLLPQVLPPPLLHLLPQCCLLAKSTTRPGPATPLPTPVSRLSSLTSPTITQPGLPISVSGWVPTVSLSGDLRVRLPTSTSASRSALTPLAAGDSTALSPPLATTARVAPCQPSVLLSPLPLRPLA